MSRKLIDWSKGAAITLTLSAMLFGPAAPALGQEQDWVPGKNSYGAKGCNSTQVKGLFLKKDYFNYYSDINGDERLYVGSEKPDPAFIKSLNSGDWEGMIPDIQFYLYHADYSTKNPASARLWVDGREVTYPLAVNRTSNRGAQVFPPYNDGRIALSRAFARGSEALLRVYDTYGNEMRWYRYDVSNFRRVPAAVRAVNWTCPVAEKEDENTFYNPFY